MSQEKMPWVTRHRDDIRCQHPTNCNCDPGGVYSGSDLVHTGAGVVCRPCLQPKDTPMNPEVDVLVTHRDPQLRDDPKPVKVDTSAGGTKFDQEKPPLANIYPEFLESMSRQLSKGDKKYGPLNWWEGLTYEQLISAAERHILAFRKGEWLDEETQEPHIIAAASTLMFLHVYHDYGRTELDDRRYAKLSKDRQALPKV